MHVLDDSLYAQASPVGTGAKFFRRFLKDSNDLNSTVVLTCLADESSNEFTKQGLIIMAIQSQKIKWC